MTKVKNGDRFEVTKPVSPCLHDIKGRGALKIGRWEPGDELVIVDVDDLMVVRNERSGDTARFGSRENMVCDYWGFRPIPASPPEVDPVPVDPRAPIGSRWRIIDTWTVNRYTAPGKVEIQDTGGIVNECTVDWLVTSCATRLPDTPAPEAGDGSGVTCGHRFVDGSHCALERGHAKSHPLIYAESKGPAPEAKPAVCGHVWMGTKGFGRKCALPEGHDGSHRVSDADADRIVRGEPPQPTQPHAPARKGLLESMLEKADALRAAPAPYACAPGCTKERRCMVGPEDDPRRCPGWTEPRFRCPNRRPWCKAEKRCGVCRHMGGIRQPVVHEDDVMLSRWYDQQAPTSKGKADPQAGQYHGGELSFTGAGATACRMTGRR